LGGAKAGNYTLTQPTLSANITAATLTVTGLTGVDKVYDTNTTASATGTAALNGILNSDDVTLTGTPGYTFAGAGVNTSISITTTGYTLGGAKAGNYTLTQPNLTAAITAKALTAASTVTSKIYDGSAVTGTVTTGAITGEVVAGDVTISTATSTDYSDANVGTGKATTISYTLANGTGLAANYSIANLVTSGTITAKQLTIAEPASLTLSKEDDASTAAEVTAGALSGVETGDVANVGVTAVANYDNANLGTGKTITVVYTLDGTSSANYIKPVDYSVNTGVITEPN